MSAPPLGLVPETPRFHGSTFDDDLDFDRLKNNTVRVFALLLDGQWHSPAELQQVGGWVEPGGRAASALCARSSTASSSWRQSGWRVASGTTAWIWTP
jgi:hypothetical protein